MKKNKIFPLLSAAFLLSAATSCIEVIEPMKSTISSDQLDQSADAYNSAVLAVTSTLFGDFTYGNSSSSARDFGYPAFYLVRDVAGQDIAQPVPNWFGPWYEASGIGQSTAAAQFYWTCYYKWINNCNKVIGLSGANPIEADAIHKQGAGTALSMRAMLYLDMTRMFAPENYAKNKSALTVPIVTESTTIAQASENPRATNEAMYAFILSDLDIAEKCLTDYNRRGDIKVPDLSVVYGLKARTYLEMSDWANARKYAKLAQKGYTIATNDEYTSRETGFNTPISSWMLCLTQKSDDPCILQNDADTSWGSNMCIEISPAVGCGYAANYGYVSYIDRHLYETIPQTDFRKKCFVDFTIDDIEDKEAQLEALSAYSDHPDWLLNTAAAVSGWGKVGGLPLKFRTANGEVGRNDQYNGFLVSVPMMRVEEMYLIEAEAAGMVNESEGIALLTAFAKQRDSKYVYGTHQDAYGNASTSVFQNEIWWQRRVEFWGEGFSMFDIKRLNKGIIRSYANSNHLETVQWNTTSTPSWMNFVIVQTETNYNNAIVNNPDPIAPSSISPEFIW